MMLPLPLHPLRMLFIKLQMRTGKFIAIFFLLLFLETTSLTLTFKRYRRH